LFEPQHAYSGITFTKRLNQCNLRIIDFKGLNSLHWLGLQDTPEIDFKGLNSLHWLGLQAVQNWHDFEMARPLDQKKNTCGRSTSRSTALT
jgi:hypothetical protein